LFLLHGSEDDVVACARAILNAGSAGNLKPSHLTMRSSVSVHPRFQRKGSPMPCCAWRSRLPSEPQRNLCLNYRLAICHLFYSDSRRKRKNHPVSCDARFDLNIAGGQCSFDLAFGGDIALRVNCEDGRDGSLRRQQAELKQSAVFFVEDKSRLFRLIDSSVQLQRAAARGHFISLDSGIAPTNPAKLVFEIYELVA